MQHCSFSNILYFAKGAFFSHTFERELTCLQTLTPFQSCYGARKIIKAGTNLSATEAYLFGRAKAQYSRDSSTCMYVPRKRLHCRLTNNFITNQ